MITVYSKINFRPPGAKPLKEWVQEQQGKHLCACGCKSAIRILPFHRAKGIPQYVHGHHTMPMTQMIRNYNNEGYFTISQVAESVGIGQTTIRRYEGTLFPLAARTGRNKTRLFLREQIGEIREAWIKTKNNPSMKGKNND